jgi:hypothetical protein
MAIFDRWGMQHTGLFTFAQSAKHVGLYQKFGYWPQYLTAIMMRSPEANKTPQANSSHEPVLLSTFKKREREQTIAACRRLTGKIKKGLDLSDEMRAALAQRTGDVVLTHSRSVLDGFAVCLIGPGSEGGEQTCYVKFGAVQGGAGGGTRFDRLLDACETFAFSRGATVEAGMNLARGAAYRRMRAHGYRVVLQGVAMQRPHAEGFNRPGAYVIKVASFHRFVPSFGRAQLRRKARTSQGSLKKHC